MSQPKRKEETLGKEMKAEEAIAYVFSEYNIKKVFMPYSTPDILKEVFTKYGISQEYTLNAREALLFAEAYARSNNILGVSIVIPGFEILGGVDVIARAYMDSIPLFILGSIRNSKDIGRARISESRSPDDIKNSLYPFIKTWERITSIEEITSAIEKGYKEALSNRPRPVYIEIGEELFRAKAFPLSTAGQKPEKKTPDKNTVAKVGEVLLNSKRPIIIAGYGIIVSEAYNELKELAELLDIPIISTIRAKGVISSDHSLYAGEGLGIMATNIGNKLFNEADVILAIGTRFSQLTTGGAIPKISGFIIHNNVDGEDLGKVIMPHLPVVADSGLFIKELLNYIKQKVKEPINRGIRNVIISNKNQDHEIKDHEGIWPVDVLNILSKFTFSKIFIDIGPTTLDLIRYPVKTPKSWITSESVVESGISIINLIQQNQPEAIAITTLRGVLHNLDILERKVEGTKGIILILNDDLTHYIDSTKSDIIRIERSNITINFDKKLEKIINAKTVTDIKHLSEILSAMSDIEIINVKISHDFQSIVLNK
jgi:thiamine pyrophosphate-dependent acetolactate synthase large subunit-like protein